MAKAGRKPKETPAVDIEDVLEMPYFQDSYWLWYDFINELENKSFQDELMLRHTQSLRSSGLTLEEKRDIIKQAYTKFAERKISDTHFDKLAVQKPSKSIIEVADLVIKYEDESISFTQLRTQVKKIEFSEFERSLISGFLDLVDRDINSTADPKAGLIRRIKKVKAMLVNENQSGSLQKLNQLIDGYGKIKTRQIRNRLINEANALLMKEIESTNFSPELKREILSINMALFMRDTVGVIKKTGLTRAQISQRLKSWFIQFEKVKNQYDWLVEACTKIMRKDFRQYLMTGPFNFEHDPRDAALEMVIHIFRKGNYNHTLNEGQRYEFLKMEIKSYFTGDMKKATDEGDGLGSIDKNSEYPRNYYSESYKQDRLNKKVNPEAFLYKKLFYQDYCNSIDVFEVMIEESVGRAFGSSKSNKKIEVKISEIDRPVATRPKPITPKSTLKKKSA